MFWAGEAGAGSGQPEPTGEEAAAPPHPGGNQKARLRLSLAGADL